MNRLNWTESAHCMDMIQLQPHEKHRKHCSRMRSTCSLPYWGLPDRDPLDRDPLGRDPLDRDPLGRDPLDTNSLDTDPLDTDPLRRDTTGQRPPGQKTPWIETPWAETPMDRAPSPVNRIIYRCKNIIFPQLRLRSVTNVRVADS